MKRKGFTLVELLAVILILSIVMLIGITAVLPLVRKAEKSSLASEGMALIDVAKTAHQSQQYSDSELKLKSTESHCFSIDWLKSHGYYEKESKDYNGSVLVVYNENGTFDYYFWISNGTYHLSAATAEEQVFEDGAGDSDSINTCGGFIARTEEDQGPREIECNIMEGYGYLPVPDGYKASECSCTYNGIGTETIATVYGLCSKKNGNETEVAIITPYLIGSVATTENFNSCEIYGTFTDRDGTHTLNPTNNCINNYNTLAEIEKFCAVYTYIDYDEYTLVCPNNTYTFTLENWLEWPKRDFNCNSDMTSNKNCNYWMGRLNSNS